MPAAKCTICKRTIKTDQPHVLTVHQVPTHISCLINETRTLFELFVLVLPRSE